MYDPSVLWLKRPVADRLIVWHRVPDHWCQFGLLPRLVDEMEKGGGGFDGDDEYARFRRSQRIHRMHLVGYAVSAVLILIGMLIFWH